MPKSIIQMLYEEAGIALNQTSDLCGEYHSLRENVEIHEKKLCGILDKESLSLFREYYSAIKDYYEFSNEYFFREGYAFAARAILLGLV